jgi:glycosyltransferase involved in cell wall biosynthesis
MHKVDLKEISVSVKSQNNNSIKNRKVTAVLPAFNAERTLAKTYAAIPKDYVDEVILVDDASSDNTVARAEEIDDLIVVVHEQNRGYGGNQKTCYSEALERGAEVVIMIHPDFQYDPSYVPHIIKPLLQGKADMVMGSRFMGADPRSNGMIWWRFWGNRFLTSLQNVVLKTKLSEGHSGYRAYTRALLEQVPYKTFSDDFVFDPEMLKAVAQMNFKIAEVPIPTRYTSESSSISFWASVKYGLETLLTLIGRDLN